jgi:hypothetical protein
MEPKMGKMAWLLWLMKWRTMDAFLQIFLTPLFALILPFDIDKIFISQVCTWQVIKILNVMEKNLSSVSSLKTLLDGLSFGIPDLNSGVVI